MSSYYSYQPYYSRACKLQLSCLTVLNYLYRQQKRGFLISGFNITLIKQVLEVV